MHRRPAAGFYLSLDHNQRVVFTGIFLRVGNTIFIFLTVFKLERINRIKSLTNFFPWLRIQKQTQAAARADTHMMTALGADIHIVFYFDAIKDSRARWALLPQAFGNRLFGALALDLGR